jgi:REP element-mobilizing transposase RayT
VVLDDARRATVDLAITDECAFRDWMLHAAAVRTNHVHVVVSGDATPERMLITLKGSATARLLKAGLAEKGSPTWARHGSTRYLWDEDAVAEAV